MKLRVNKRMLELLGGDPAFYESGSIDFPPELMIAASLRFKEVDGCVVPLSFSGEKIWTKDRPAIPNRDDQTGFEALHSKVHLDSYFPDTTDISELARSGLDFAFFLRKGLLESKVSGPFRIIASVHEADAELTVPATCTVRFHKVRPGQSWLNDDLESYRQEALMVMDI
jgi:hypothetical protein